MMIICFSILYNSNHYVNGKTIKFKDESLISPSFCSMMELPRRFLLFNNLNEMLYDENNVQSIIDKFNQKHKYSSVDEYYSAIDDFVFNWLEMAQNGYIIIYDNIDQKYTWPFPVKNDGRGSPYIRKDDQRIVFFDFDYASDCHFAQYCQRVHDHRDLRANPENPMLIPINPMTVVSMFMENYIRDTFVSHFTPPSFYNLNQKFDNDYDYDCTSFDADIFSGNYEDIVIEYEHEKCDNDDDYDWNCDDHSQQACNPLTGCAHLPSYDDTGCLPGDQCQPINTNTNTNRYDDTGCLPSDQCQSINTNTNTNNIPILCDDGLPCTYEEKCPTPPIPDSVPCDDSNFCTAAPPKNKDIICAPGDELCATPTDYCTAGVCMSKPIGCEHICNPATGMCTYSCCGFDTMPSYSFDHAHNNNQKNDFFDNNNNQKNNVFDNYYAPWFFKSESDRNLQKDVSEKEKRQKARTEIFGESGEKIFLRYGISVSIFQVICFFYLVTSLDGTLTLILAFVCSPITFHMLSQTNLTNLFSINFLQLHMWFILCFISYNIIIPFIRQISRDIARAFCEFNVRILRLINHIFWITFDFVGTIIIDSIRYLRQVSNEQYQEQTNNQQQNQQNTTCRQRKRQQRQTNINNITNNNNINIINKKNNNNNNNKKKKVVDTYNNKPENEKEE